MKKILSNDKALKEKTDEMNEELVKATSDISVIKEEYATREFLMGNLQAYATNIQMAIVE